MANQTLAEFTEKTFVADADWTFVWDTAGLISKKVSRNSLLSVGSIATSTPVTISQTWTDAAVAFAAMKIVATDTNSAAGSDFLELYSGSATQPLRFDVQKTGQMNIYGAWTDPSNYERLSFSAPTAANAVIGTNKAGTGTARGLDIQVDGSTRLTFPVSGNPTFGTAVTFALDIAGQRDVYCGAGRHFRYTNNSAFTSAGAGIVVFEDLGASNATPRFQLGGTSASFPALKRSTTSLQAVLANDSGFTNIQGKLTTDTAYTGTTVVPTGFITLYDSTGTAYKVPCVAA